MIKKILVLLSIATIGNSVIATTSTSTTTTTTTAPTAPTAEEKKDLELGAEYRALYDCMTNQKNSNELLKVSVLPNPIRYENEEVPANAFPEFPEVKEQFRPGNFKGERVPIYNGKVDEQEKISMDIPRYAICFFKSLKNIVEDLEGASRANTSNPIELSDITKGDLDALMKLVSNLHGLVKPKYWDVDANKKEIHEPNDAVTEFKKFFYYAKNQNNIDPQKEIFGLIQEVFEFKSVSVSRAVDEVCGATERVAVTDAASRLMSALNFLDCDFLLHALGRLVAKTLHGCDLKGMAVQLHVIPPEESIREFLGIKKPETTVPAVTSGDANLVQ